MTISPNLIRAATEVRWWCNLNFLCRILQSTFAYYISQSGTCFLKVSEIFVYECAKSSDKQQRKQAAGTQRDTSATGQKHNGHYRSLTGLFWQNSRLQSRSKNSHFLPKEGVTVEGHALSSCKWKTKGVMITTNIKVKHHGEALRRRLDTRGAATIPYLVHVGRLPQKISRKSIF